MRIFVLNSGSSSIKYCVYEMPDEIPLFSGKIERVGSNNSLFLSRDHTAHGGARDFTENRPVADHADGLAMIFDTLRDLGPDSGNLFDAAGHRVVHGGEAFREPVIINASTVDAIEDMIPLAPQHNPPNLHGIKVTQHHYPDIPQVAVFDTSFFTSLPPRAYRYAIPDRLYREHHVRRYGFHGSSHAYVASEAARLLEHPLEQLRLITVHLGNGASMSAIDRGVCIDTSMGMTPTEGLVMGTRCGDLDPALHFYLARNAGMALGDIETMLISNSGLKGLCGTNDMREVHRLAEAGDEQARLAVDVYCYRASKYVGAYFTALAGLDALVFTGGIGENDALVRELICEPLSVLGVTLDKRVNRACAGQRCAISAAGSRISVLTIPANEELAIARQAFSLLIERGLQ